MDNRPMEFEKEWAKMMAGERYEAFHPGFAERLMATREKIREFNDLPPRELAGQQTLLRDLLGSMGCNLVVNQPFRCDFGCNIHIGDNCIINFNMTILDEAPVRIGDNVFIGPNCSIYTACHPLEIPERNRGVEWAEPVTIGNSVWIGGSTVILPGVTIGDGCVIGAGSVVCKDIEPYTLAVGNPCRPLRKLER